MAEAQAAEDYETIHIEEIKLAMAERIQTQFLQITDALGAQEQ